MTSPTPRPTLTPGPPVATGQAVSAGTVAMILATMLLLLSGGVEIFMQASWEWWVVPLACVALIVVVVAQRFARRQRAAEEGRLTH